MEPGRHETPWEKEMSTTQEGTVKQMGASEGDVLIGIEPEANIGLKIRVSASQPIGEGGRIQGGFTILDPGTGRYADGIGRVVREREQIATFQTVADFLLRLQQISGCETATHILNANSLRRVEAGEGARARERNPTNE
jgi:hypothetical protein